MPDLEIRLLGENDADLLLRAAADVFDNPLDPRATDEFLQDPRHHIVVAIDAGTIVGFASAVHYLHPDKPAPELWINEVGVALSHQRRGVARAILQRLLEHACDLGCTAAWVITERGNDAARRLYRSAGGAESPNGEVMFEFGLGRRFEGS